MVLHTGAGRGQQRLGHGKVSKYAVRKYVCTEYVPVQSTIATNPAPTAFGLVHYSRFVRFHSTVYESYVDLILRFVRFQCNSL